MTMKEQIQRRATTVKMRDQIDVLTTSERRNREALAYVVRGSVTWLPRQYVATVKDMPPRMIRLGLIAASAPMVIVHEVDSLRVYATTPTAIADWHWEAVAKFEGLADFLREFANLEAPMNKPEWAWRRREAPRAPKEDFARELVDGLKE